MFDISSLLDTIHGRDRQTDGQTEKQTLDDGKYSAMYSVAR